MHPRSEEIISYMLFKNGTAMALNANAVVSLVDGGTVDGMDIYDATGAVTLVLGKWEFELFGCGIIREFNSRPTYGELALCSVTALVSIGLDADRIDYILASYGDYIANGGRDVLVN